jgi:uncharacterized protein (DUF983 family)
MTPLAPLPALLPETWAKAALRGLMGRCPRCGEGRLFGRWLKPLATCADCGQDWTHQRADDFPAYVAILVTGHLLAPLIIVLSLDFDLGPAAMAAIILPLAVAMLLGMLQPAKGAIIALQWWHGLHGFSRAVSTDVDTPSARSPDPQ